MNRISQYRSMWIFVFFDLPTDTLKDRREATKFRNNLIDDGFSMFQFSFYIRHCASRENADVHARRVRSYLPENGYVGMMYITDKQFSQIEIFFQQEKTPPVHEGVQLELF